MSTVIVERRANPQDEAGHKQESSPNIFEGTLLSMYGNTFVMTGKDGKDYSHTLAKDAMLAWDGFVCKAEDLQIGKKIRVITKKDDWNIATSVVSLDKKTEPSQCCS